MMQRKKDNSTLAYHKLFFCFLRNVVFTPFVKIKSKKVFLACCNMVATCALKSLMINVQKFAAKPKENGIIKRIFSQLNANLISLLLLIK